MKRPAFQFYPGDWLRDTALRACSIEARGLWIDLLALMHQAEPYGHLVLNGTAITDATLSRMVGEPINKVRKALAELEANGVSSRNEAGYLYSRRMVKDERLRNTRAESGHEGGNPKLTHGYNKPGYLYAISRASDGAVKIGIAVNPMGRLYKLRQANKPDTLALVDCIEVQDMGLSELRAHEKFAHKKVIGEWFSLVSEDLLSLGFTLKGELKDKKTPSSSSSSSSSKEKRNTPASGQKDEYALRFGARASVQAEPMPIGSVLPTLRRTA